MSALERVHGQHFVAIGLNVIAVALWGLHLYVRWLPPTPAPIPSPSDAEASWWGLWPATYAPAWFMGAATVLVLGLIGLLWLWSWTAKMPGPSHSASASLSSPPLVPASTASSSSMFLLGAMGLLLVWAFFAFPIVHTRWGDAYLINKALAWPDPALRLTHSWQAPLDVFLHSQLWLTLHQAFQWQDTAPVYRLLSPLAGLCYLIVALILSRQQWLGPAWLTFGSLATLGLIQLFFGYIENYSFAATGILLYLGLGLAVLRGRVPLWAAALALSVTNATHPSTVVLAPSLLYIGWQLVARVTVSAQSTHKPRRYSLRMATLQIGLPVIAVALATVLFMEVGGHGIQALLTDDRPGGGDARWLVPLWATSTRWEYYTMFSWEHLRDFLNEQMLVAPVVLPSLVWIGMETFRRRRSHKRSLTASQPLEATGRRAADFDFLLIATLCYIGFIWLWNPDYGGQRDWDLFSLASIPAALLFSESVALVLPERQYLRTGALPLLIIQALHTIIWIYQNTLPWEWP